MRIFKEKEVFSPDREVWVCVDRPYLYMSTTLIGLLWILVTEWRQDKHLGE